MANEVNYSLQAISRDKGNSELALFVHIAGVKKLAYLPMSLNHGKAS